MIAEMLYTTKQLSGGPFTFYLCKAFLCANIPLNKLFNSNFLKKYTNQLVQDQSTK